MNEFYSRIDAENIMQSNSIASFVEYLYGVKNSKSNLIQVYHVNEIVIKIILETHIS